MESDDGHLREVQRLFLQHTNRLRGFILGLLPDRAAADDPPMILIYGYEARMGKEVQDPVHSTNFGFSFQTKCRELNVECQLTYPRAKDAKHPYLVWISSSRSSRHHETHHIFNRHRPAARTVRRTTRRRCRPRAVHEWRNELPDRHSDQQPTPALQECLAQTARLLQTAFKANGADVAVVSEPQRDAAKPALMLGNTQFAQKNGLDVTKLRDWSYTEHG